MARARNIKPGLYKNEDLAECSIWARYIFPGLWTLADREGRLEDRPKRIKGELLPFDSQDVEPLLRELATRKFILRYEVDGVRYIQILKFKAHQTPHYSEKESVIKPPPPQEKDADTSPGNSGSTGGMNSSETQEDTKKPPGIKGGSQPSDSLIPDLLIPDSGFPSKEKTKRNGHAAAAAFALPDWIPVRQWEAWIDARRKKRNPPTKFAMQLAISKLEELKTEGHSPAAVLAQSAFNGWAGLFPVKQ